MKTNNSLTVTIQDTQDCFYVSGRLTKHEFEYVIKYAAYNKEKGLFFFKKDVGSSLINDKWIPNNSKNILVNYFTRRNFKVTGLK